MRRRVYGRRAGLLLVGSPSDALRSTKAHAGSFSSRSPETPIAGFDGHGIHRGAVVRHCRPSPVFTSISHAAGIFQAQSSLVVVCELRFRVRSCPVCFE